MTIENIKKEQGIYYVLLDAEKRKRTKALRIPIPKRFTMFIE